MSPETLVKRTSPAVSASKRMSPETVFASAEPATGPIRRSPETVWAETSPATFSRSGVAADRLELRVAADPAADLGVAGDGVDSELAELPAEACVRGCGLDLDVCAVRDRGSHPEVVVAEHDGERGEREAELALAAVRDDETAGVVADLDFLEEPLVAGDGDERLLALGRLDLDVAGGYSDLEVKRQRSVEGAFEHQRYTRVSRLTRSRISLSRGVGRRSGRSGRSRSASTSW